MRDANVADMTKTMAIIAVAAFVGLYAGEAKSQASPGPAPADAVAELKADVQGRADHQAYPITGIKSEDVRAVLAGIKSLDRDEWAAAWSAMGARYAARAAAEKDRAAAREDWHQAWLDFMFGAWPAQTTQGKRAAFAKSTDAFRHYARLFDPPVETVRIPYEDGTIVGYLQLPKGARPAPVVITIGGLDEYKEYSVEHSNQAFMKAKLGVLALDMPGTGESPAKMDPGADRMFSKAIDFLLTRRDVDGHRLAIQGVSAGGYWSALMAYVERERLKGAVVWGGPVHGYFQADWQRKSWGTHEYLFGLKEARMAVYGTADDESFLSRLSQFSLLDRGVLSRPSAPMLVVNGEKDSQVPIDDLYLLLRTGTPKYAWVNPVGGHVGRSADMSEGKIHQTVVVPWLSEAVAGKFQ